MTPGLTIRPARPGDRAAITALLTSVALPVDDLHPSLEGFLVATPNGTPSEVSSPADRIIGTIGVERYGDAALLRSVAVHADARGTGLGIALVERAIEEARAAGIVDLYLLTNTAIDWAPRFGFARIARDAVHEDVRRSPQFTGLTCSSAVAMHRALRGAAAASPR